MKEIWKAVPNSQGFYFVSNKGRMKNIDRRVWHRGNKTFHNFKGKVLKVSKNPRIYTTLSVNVGGVKFYRSLHSLIAEAFIPNPENKPTVNHINSIRCDNRVGNLEWATYSENSKHGYTHGFSNSDHCLGSKNFKSKLSESDIPQIRALKREGLFNRQIGERFGVKRQCIDSVINGETWKHIAE